MLTLLLYYMLIFNLMLYDKNELHGDLLIWNSLLFEFLAMSGMLMDYNWTEIVKRKELFR